MPSAHSVLRSPEPSPRHPLSPCPLHPTPLPSGQHHPALCLCGVYKRFLPNQFTFFHPAPHPLPLTAVSLLCVSGLLFLFGLLNYRFHI